MGPMGQLFDAPLDPDGNISTAVALINLDDPLTFCLLLPAG